MGNIISAFICGALFGGGLTIAGMINPAKIANFLDVVGTWDPSLILVMASAVSVTAIGYRLVFGHGQPLFADTFSLPTTADIDGRLLTGAAIFGVGWGIGGYCPGPALAGLFQGEPKTLVFLVTMVFGLIAGRLATEATTTIQKST
jgi:uncharacterized protein